MHHFIKAWGDEARQADDIHLFVAGDLQDLLRRDHHAQIDDLVIVAGQHDAHDVLADVMHIAFDRGHQDLARAFAAFAAIGELFGVHIGQQHRDGLFHHAGGFDHLRQEHLARAKQVTHHIHARHQRAFDHMERALGHLAGGFGVFFDEFGDAVDQRMFQPLFHRPVTPCQIADLFFARAAFEAGGDVEHPVGGIGAAVEDHIFAGRAQVGVDLIVDHQLACVDDAHIHPRLNGVVEKDRVHGFAHRVIAAKAERQVRHAARDMGVGQVLANPAGGFDEIDAVVVVLFDPGGDGEDIGVEDDIFGGEIQLFHQDAIGAGADVDLALIAVGLPGFVKGHDHDGSAIGHAEPRLMAEAVFAFLEADGVHHRLALDAFQAGFDHLPFGAVDHHGHAGDIGFGGQKVEEFDHGRAAVDQAFVHVDIKDLRAVFDLIAGDFERCGVVAVDDQFAKAGGAGDVCPLADVHEADVGGEDERFQPRKAQVASH